MRQLTLVTALLALLTFAASTMGSAAPRNPIDQPLDKRSGFFDFGNFNETLPSGSGGPGRGTIAGVACSTSVASQPADFAGNFLLNCDTAGTVSIRNETTIAVNPTDPNNVIGGSHRYLLTSTGATLNIHVIAVAYVTKNGGSTWTTVQPPLGSWEFTGDPVLAFDADGRAYYFNIADHEGQGGSFTGPSVIAQRSDDGGSTWTQPATVARGVGAIANGPTAVIVFNDKEWGTADANASSPLKNNVYVTWTRFLFLQQSYIESPIFFSRSTDGGLTWSEGKEISGSSAALCTKQIDPSGGATRCDENQFSQPVVGPDGTIYVTFLNDQNPSSTGFRDQVLLVKSTDGGNTWSAPVAVSPIIHDGANDYPLNTDGRQRISGCAYRVNAAGALALGPGRLYYVYTENNGSATTTQTDIMVVTSTNGGTTWSAPVAVNSSTKDQVYPWAAVDTGGKLRVGYVDHDRTGPADQTCVYGYSLSTATAAGATTFTRQTLETGLSIASNSRWFSKNTRFIGDYTNVAVGPDGSVWADWTDLRHDVTAFGITRKGQDAVAEKRGP
jgi:hypothetical protein